MNTQSTSTWIILQSAARRGIANWRIGIIWIIATLIPTAVVTLPLGRLLAESLDHSVFAADWAAQMSLSTLVEWISNSTDSAPLLMGAVMISLLITLLLWPFLSAMVISTVTEPQPAGFVALIRGGARTYGRMLRMLLWSAVPWGIAGGIGGTALHLAKKMGEKAVLESTADHQFTAALILLIVLLVLAHITEEAGRAQFALDPSRRSAVKAWWRGVKLVKSHPLAAFGNYLGLTLAGFVLMAIVGVIRINTPHAGLFGILVAFVLTQVIVMAAVWMRTARLLALVQIGASPAAR
jgi:hypothetical protein